MQGKNRALKSDYLYEKAERIFSNIKESEVPCIFISYQRKDENYASKVADYIMSKQIDVYFDLEDDDLKLSNQRNNPKAVTDAIRNGLNRSDFMLVIVSPDTYRSLWVPFEVGYAYDKKGAKMKILRHKGISKTSIPAYLKVKDMLHGTRALNSFLNTIRKKHHIYESLLEKEEPVKSFSEYSSNPLSKYLDNE